MFQLTEEEQMMTEMVRKWADEKLGPKVRDLDAEKLLPYDLMRDFVRTFGLDEMARGVIDRLDENAPPKSGGKGALMAKQRVFAAITGREFAKWSPAFMMATMVTTGLTTGAIMSRGTVRQKKRWALPLFLLDKIGSWAITEPGAGSDAFGSMKSTARRDGDFYVLNGSKTFITNAPYAEIFVVYVRLQPQGHVVPFVLERGMPGFAQSKPMRKMGMHGSPTGELFMEEVRVPKENLLGETEAQPARDLVKEGFFDERTGVVGACLGIVERCLDQSLRYAKEREQFGRKIGEYQLIQQKLAKMYVARENLLNLYYKHLWMIRENISMTLAEASAWKLYVTGTATDVAMEAVQIHGGNGYMAEYHVEMLARDAKLFQIGGGTDEIQIGSIARHLLTEGIPPAR